MASRPGRGPPTAPKPNLVLRSAAVADERGAVVADDVAEPGGNDRAAIVADDVAAARSNDVAATRSNDVATTRSDDRVELELAQLGHQLTIEALVGQDRRVRRIADKGN